MALLIVKQNEIPKNAIFLSQDGYHLQKPFSSPKCV